MKSYQFTPLLTSLLVLPLFSFLCPFPSHSHPACVWHCEWTRIWYKHSYLFWIQNMSLLEGVAGLDMIKDVPGSLFVNSEFWALWLSRLRPHTTHHGGLGLSLTWGRFPILLPSVSCHCLLSYQNKGKTCLLKQKQYCNICWEKPPEILRDHDNKLHYYWEIVVCKMAPIYQGMPSSLLMGSVSSWRYP